MTEPIRTGRSPAPLATRRSLLAGAVAAMSASVVPSAAAEDPILTCARQLLADAREAGISLTYDPARDRIVFRSAGEGPRTEAEEDLGFYVKWGLRVRPRLREAVIALLVGA